MEGNWLRGIFTERDVLKRVVAAGLDAETTSVSDVMTTQLAYIRASTTVREAMLIVNTKGCRHLPVLDGDRLLGIVSVRDLINHVVDGQEHQIAELVHYIAGNYGPEASLIAKNGA
jgi:CBS domain-containing protein